MTKAMYVAPVLRAHGHVESMTKMQSSGTVLDADFKGGTPLSEVTLS